MRDLHSQIEVALEHEALDSASYLDPRCAKARDIIMGPEGTTEAYAWAEGVHAKRCRTCRRFNREVERVKRKEGSQAAHDFWTEAWNEGFNPTSV